MYPNTGVLPSLQSQEPAETPSVLCFSVVAAADPGVMPRVLEFFAKRGLVPARWVSQLTGPGERELSIDIQVKDLSPEAGRHIARCLDQLHDVRLVLTSEKAAA